MQANFRFVYDDLTQIDFSYEELNMAWARIDLLVDHDINLVTIEKEIHIRLIMQLLTVYPNLISLKSSNFVNFSVRFQSVTLLMLLADFDQYNHTWIKNSARGAHL